MSGIVAKLYLRPSARTPVREVSAAEAVAGRGLEGDHSGGGARQVTVMSLESWEAACGEIGRPELSSGSRRANVIVKGVDLARSIGGGLRIGECLIRVAGETRPCRLMDDVTPGLQHALDPACRAGVYGRILVGGEIGVGDSVIVVQPEALNEHVDQLRIPFADAQQAGG